jgi:lysophospholipase L1-like esterase
MRTQNVLWILILVGLAWGAHLWWRAGHWGIVNAPPRPGPIIALGDSLTAGNGAPEGGAWPEVLARRLGRPVINRGVAGDTVGDAAERLERDVLSRDPAIVIVLLGGNDMLRQLDLDRSLERLEQMVRRIQAGGSMVVVVGLKGLSPVGGVGGRYKDLARRTGGLYVPDILDDIFGRSGRMADTIHPNGQGHAIMAERIAEALEPFL